MEALGGFITRVGDIDDEGFITRDGDIDPVRIETGETLV